MTNFQPFQLIPTRSGSQFDIEVPGIADHGMLIVTEIVEPADAYGFALAVAIGAAPDEAPFNDRDNDMLKQAVDGLIEKYSDVVRNRGAIYAHAAVRLDRGWRFVYLTLLLVAPADCVKH